uniref:Rx N-terminal domain-containing protein n=1 Tax=Leersia perrieri TaxID=77586 RepID=A0A0D9XUV0_9ORYZ
MESMNGLLLHLTEAQYRDHQVRAWMRQVAGITRDSGNNVELYVHYVGGDRSGGGVLGYLWRIPRLVRTVTVRHRIAMRIRELKVRARNVGDRRKRYGVTVPSVLPDHQLHLHGSATDQVLQANEPEEEEHFRRRHLLYGQLPPHTVDGVFEEVLKLVLEEQWEEYDEPNPRHIRIGSEGSAQASSSIARRVFEHP